MWRVLDTTNIDLSCDIPVSDYCGLRSNIKMNARGPEDVVSEFRLRCF